MSPELHIVGFQVGRETYGVPITSLHEIVRVPEITAVPDAPDYMEGVINLRGKIVSVIDLRKRFGETKVALNRRNRILVVEHSGRLCGLIVDSASEVLKIPAAEIEPSPTTLQDGGLNCVTGLGKYQRTSDRVAGYVQAAGQRMRYGKNRRSGKQLRRAGPPPPGSSPRQGNKNGRPIEHIELTCAVH